MTDVLVYADTIRSADLRHAVPIPIPDPFLYAEAGGRRHVVVSVLEVPRVAALGLEVHPYEEYGWDELRGSGMRSDDIRDEVNLRAVRAIGVTRAVVPAAFPLGLADELRAAGVELVPDDEHFVDLRRVKNEAELAGIRRAQAAAEAGMKAARDVLRRAKQNGSGLEVDGQPLTCELVKAAVSQAFVAHDATGEDFVVSHGAQSAIGHHMGEGRIVAGEPVVVDLWPRDNASGCCADMTRTFVLGELPDELVEWHRLCVEALERATADVRPGVTARSVFDGACDVFEAAGHPTQRTKTPGEPLEDGFFHSLGHGVGLEVHEHPILGFNGQEALRAGEVLALEPGLYRPGYGGCRVEDLLLVTDGGAERLTDFPYDLTP